jgi:hypothetical protein
MTTTEDVSMQPILLNQENLKSIAHKACEQVRTLKGKPTYMGMLHILSVAAYGRPYEETLATVFAAPAVVTTSSASTGSVIMLCHGNERIIMIDDSYVASNHLGGDDEVSIEHMNGLAQQLAENSGYDIVECQVPQVLGENADEDAVIDLARKMGYFNQYGSIFNCFDGAKIFIDNMHCPCGMKSDWLYTITAMDDEPFEDFTVWYPEATDSDGNLYEYYVSFGELCNATTHDGKTWTVIDGGNYELRIEFFK